MADFVPAEGDGGRVGYGLGLEKYALPGGLEMIGHSGGTAGYRSGAFYFPALDLTMTFALSVEDNPIPVILAALKVMAPDSFRKRARDTIGTRMPRSTPPPPSALRRPRAACAILDRSFFFATTRPSDKSSKRSAPASGAASMSLTSTRSPSRCISPVRRPTTAWRASS